MNQNHARTVVENFSSVRYRSAEITSFASSVIKFVITVNHFKKELNVSWLGDTQKTSDKLSNKEAHEEAAGMPLDDLFFTFNNIDPNQRNNNMLLTRCEGKNDSYQKIGEIKEHQNVTSGCQLPSGTTTLWLARWYIHKYT
jgi:hypothetical protein